MDASSRIGNAAIEGLAGGLVTGIIFTLLYLLVRFSRWLIFRSYFLRASSPVESRHSFLRSALGAVLVSTIALFIPFVAGGSRTRAHVYYEDMQLAVASWLAIVAAYISHSILNYRRDELKRAVGDQFSVESLTALGIVFYFPIMSTFAHFILQLSFFVVLFGFIFAERVRVDAGVWELYMTCFILSCFVGVLWRVMCSYLRASGAETVASVKVLEYLFASLTLASLVIFSAYSAEWDVFELVNHSNRKNLLSISMILGGMAFIAGTSWIARIMSRR